MAADPWELLREARESVFRDSLCREYDDTHKTAAMEEHKRRTRLLDRIDAALAERQDSATDVVEWRLGDDCDEEFVYYEAYPDSDTGLDVVRFLGGKWRWTMSREKQGYCDTLDEAKQAAIAAARGMR